MTAQKTTLLVVTCFLIVSIMVMLVQFLLRPLKAKGLADKNFKASFGVWNAMLLLSGAIVFSRTINFTIEAIDVTLKIKSASWKSDLLISISLFTGVSVVWSVIWYFVSSLLTRVFIANRQDSIEIENNHYWYFVIKGCLYAAILYALVPVLDNILRVFMPSIPTVIYH
jgi:hypothetical protein